MNSIFICGKVFRMWWTLNDRRSNKALHDEFLQCVLLIFCILIVAAHDGTKWVEQKYLPKQENTILNQGKTFFFLEKMYF